jgi:hypothetical protein
MLLLLLGPLERRVSGDMRARAEQWPPPSRCERRLAAPSASPSAAGFQPPAMMGRR